MACVVFCSLLMMAMKHKLPHVESWEARSWICYPHRQPATPQSDASPWTSSLRPNPRMQPTGRVGPALHPGAALLEASSGGAGLCGRGLEGLQLMRMSLGRRTSICGLTDDESA